MMMMTSGINAVNSPVQPHSVGASAYAPSYSYRPEDERQAFVAPLATTLGVGTLGAMGVAAWENTNAPKRFYQEAVTAELANNPTATPPATPKNSKAGSPAHKQVMADYLKTVKKADGTPDAFTPKEIEKLSQKGLGEVKEALEKKGVFVEADWKTNITDNRAYAEKLKVAERQIHYDDGVKKMLSEQVDSTNNPIYDAKGVDAKLAELKAGNAEALFTEELDSNIKGKLSDFDLANKEGTVAQINEKARLSKSLEEAKVKQLEKFKKLDDIRSGTTKKFTPKSTPGNGSPDARAPKNTGIKLTDAEAHANVLNGTSGKKITQAEVNRLFKDGKVSTPTDAGKAAIKEFGDNAIKKAGDWEVKGKSMATKGGLILAGAAVVGTIAGVVNSGNVRANNEAQLNALLAQERAASA